MKEQKIEKTMIMSKREEEEKAPIVLAFYDNGGYKIHCPYCGRWHLHGMADGYRVSHCGSGTSRGYVIKKISGIDYREVKSGIAIEEKVRKKQRSSKK